MGSGPQRDRISHTVRRTDPGSVPADLETSGFVRTRLNIAGDWASRPTTEAGWAELAAEVAGRFAGLSARARLQPA